MKVQFVTSQSGERMAMLPADEFERLLDAAEANSDVAAYDEAKRRIVAGEDELLPAAVANRLLDGENPVRVFRQHRGLSATDLARHAGVAKAYLSQIESGARQGSVSTLQALAQVLGVSIDDLV